MSTRLPKSMNNAHMVMSLKDVKYWIEKFYNYNPESFYKFDQETKLAKANSNLEQFITLNSLKPLLKNMTNLSKRYTALCVNRDIEVDRNDPQWLYDEGSIYDHMEDIERIQQRSEFSLILYAHLN